MIDLIRAALAALVVAPAALVLLAAATISVILDGIDDPQHGGRGS